MGGKSSAVWMDRSCYSWYSWCSPADPLVPWHVRLSYQIKIEPIRSLICYAWTFSVLIDSYKWVPPPKTENTVILYDALMEALCQNAKAAIKKYTNFWNSTHWGGVFFVQKYLPAERPQPREATQGRTPALRLELCTNIIEENTFNWDGIQLSQREQMAIPFLMTSFWLSQHFSTVCHIPSCFIRLQVIKPNSFPSKFRTACAPWTLPV